MAALNFVFRLKGHTGLYRIAEKYIVRGVMIVWIDVSYKGDWLSFCKSTADELIEEMLPVE